MINSESIRANFNSVIFLVTVYKTYTEFLQTDIVAKVKKCKVSSKLQTFFQPRLYCFQK